MLSVPVLTPFSVLCIQCEVYSVLSVQFSLLSVFTEHTQRVRCIQCHVYSVCSAFSAVGTVVALEHEDLNRQWKLPGNDSTVLHCTVSCSCPLHPTVPTLPACPAALGRRLKASGRFLTGLGTGAPPEITGVSPMTPWDDSPFLCPPSAYRAWSCYYN